MKNYGKTAYEAYRQWAGGKSLVSRQPIPPWEGLSADIRDAWEMSAKAVVDEVRGENPPTSKFVQNV